MNKSINNKQIYIASAVIVTIGMLIMKGIATVINVTVALLLS